MVHGAVRTRDYERDGVKHRIVEVRAETTIQCQCVLLCRLSWASVQDSLVRSPWRGLRPTFTVVREAARWNGLGNRPQLPGCPTYPNSPVFPPPRQRLIADIAETETAETKCW
jgi:hypothetical protein